MRRGSDAWAAEADASFLFRPVDEFGHGLCRHMIGGDYEHVGQFPGERDRDYVALRIVWHALVEELIDREMTDGGRTDGVTVGRTGGDSRDTDISAGARPVFYHQRLPPQPLQILR